MRRKLLLFALIISSLSYGQHLTDSRSHLSKQDERVLETHFEPVVDIYGFNFHTSKKLKDSEVKRVYEQLIDFLDRDHDGYPEQSQMSSLEQFDSSHILLVHNKSEKQSYFIEDTISLFQYSTFKVVSVDELNEKMKKGREGSLEEHGQKEETSNRIEVKLNTEKNYHVDLEKSNDEKLTNNTRQLAIFYQNNDITFGYNEFFNSFLVFDNQGFSVVKLNDCFNCSLNLDKGTYFYYAEQGEQLFSGKIRIAKP